MFQGHCHCGWTLSTATGTTEAAARVRPLGLVYTGRVTLPSEIGPVTRASNSTLPLFLVAVHTILLVLVSRMSPLRTSWRRQRLALKKCLTRVYDVLLDEVSDIIEEEQNRKKRLWVRDRIGRRDSRGASTLFV